jgi:hypothetical protein
MDKGKDEESGGSTVGKGKNEGKPNGQSEHDGQKEC